MAENKEQARRIGEAIMVCSYPDVCKSPTTPVPYMIVSNFINSQEVATTVNATKDPTFTKASFIQGVIGDEGGTGGGVCSGTFAGGGACWATDWAHTVRAEGKNVVRNQDPVDMNGHSDKSSPNTKGTVVYQKAGAPNGKVDSDGRPTDDTNPMHRIRITQYGYPGDPYSDWYTRHGLGTNNIKLQPDSAAINQEGAQLLGAKVGDQVLVQTNKGTQIRKIVDVISSKIHQPRLDLYMPGGEDTRMDDFGQVMVIHPGEP